MQRPLVQLVDRALLHELAEVHDPDPVAEVPHHRQVVRDEQVGQAEVALQVVEQVEHPGLHAHVECADRLVEHDHLGFHGERPRDADALALTAGELVRIAVGVRGVQADLREQLEDPLASGCRRCSPWITSGSVSVARTDLRGFSEAYGSWNTNCMRRRSARSREPSTP